MQVWVLQAREETPGLYQETDNQEPDFQKNSKEGSCVATQCETEEPACCHHLLGGSASH